MLLVLVLVSEQSSVVTQLALMRMMMVHWMPSVERLLELGHRISAEMVQILLMVYLWMLDQEPSVEIAQFLFVRDVYHFLRHLPELHLLGLHVHLECRQCCQGLVAVRFVSCLAQGYEAFGTLLSLSASATALVRV